MDTPAVASIVTFAASISISPAAAVNAIASVPLPAELNIMEELFAFTVEIVISSSSPSVVLVIAIVEFTPSISSPPAEAVNAIASATASFDDKFTDDPVAVISMSSPAAAPEASISIPPAEAVNAIASAAVPAELINKDASTAPVCAIVKSCAPPSDT